ncbi:hypothetical protein PR048_026395 [Dryococelus australis]|uniref:Uncharacterized protein n=1 Tax=Dryococelus australis TaxID=614101 RepID=A0ABQ9GL69_9NEOP|nr:hypothetical protein PR048_026395 [Dryococelus australis]
MACDPINTAAVQRPVVLVEAIWLSAECEVKCETTADAVFVVRMDEKAFPQAAYWLLLRAPRMYRHEQAPAYLATLRHTPLQQTPARLAIFPPFRGQIPHGPSSKASHVKARTGRKNKIASSVLPPRFCLSGVWATCALLPDVDKACSAHPPRKHDPSNINTPLRARVEVSADLTRLRPSSCSSSGRRTTINNYSGSRAIHYTGLIRPYDVIYIHNAGLQRRTCIVCHCQVPAITVCRAEVSPTEASYRLSTVQTLKNDSFYHGAAVAERLACSPPTKSIRVQSPVGSSDFCMWESLRTMPLIGGFSRDLPPPPRHPGRPILTSITLIGSQDHAAKSRPDICTHSFNRDQPIPVPLHWSNAKLSKPRIPINWTNVKTVLLQRVGKGCQQTHAITGVLERVRQSATQCVQAIMHASRALIVESRVAGIRTWLQLHELECARKTLDIHPGEDSRHEVAMVRPCFARTKDERWTVNVLEWSPKNYRGSRERPAGCWGKDIHSSCWS